MKISVIGSGYVGLVSGACFAELGHDVIFVDSQDARIRAINTSNPDFYEPGLKELLAKNKTRINATKDLEKAVKETDVTFICVGTPEFNLVSRTVEMGIAEDERITMENSGPGNGVINVIEAPLGEMSVNGRGSRQARQLGYFFGSCPAALYIAGPDDEGTQAAGYDLISRIWGSERRYE